MESNHPPSQLPHSSIIARCLGDQTAHSTTRFTFVSSFLTPSRAPNLLRHLNHYGRMSRFTDTKSFQREAWAPKSKARKGIEETLPVPKVASHMFRATVSRSAGSRLPSPSSPWGVAGPQGATSGLSLGLRRFGTFDCLLLYGMHLSEARSS